MSLCDTIPNFCYWLELAQTFSEDVSFHHWWCVEFWWTFFQCEPCDSIKNTFALILETETETLIVSLTMSVVKHLILRLCIFVSSHRSRVPGKRGFNLTFILIWIYYSVLRQNAAGHVSGVWYCSWLTPMLLNISGVSLLDHTQFSPIRLDILLFNLI